MVRRTIHAEGHLIDSGILSNILNTILAKGGDYRIINVDVGKTPQQSSRLDLELIARDETHLETLMAQLRPFGVFEAAVPPALLIPATSDRFAPEAFYSTSNHRTEVFHGGRWHAVAHQRMDGVLVYDPGHDAFSCKKLRDLREGDLVVCSGDSVRVFPEEARRKKPQGDDGFAFMTNTVSSERSVESAVDQIAKEMRRIKDRGGKTVVVCGPVVIHTGGSEALASLVRAGFVHGLLSGNAIAVHDLEVQFFGTSLGVNLKTGEAAQHGHSHHMRAINTIYGCGSIAAAVQQGIVKGGLMYELIKTGTPYCLAGSIRDDGPLPETVTDMIEAQRRYAGIIEGADMIIMLSTMLHSIGVGNMTPSWVRTVCVDINPAVVTKLSDRGSSQAIGIVSDVGFFLRALARSLQ
jgi:lysine-ketoglutarate reductase/saccharopine dehydrogenase-like protein (TIGR00300 family)